MLIIIILSYPQACLTDISQWMPAHQLKLSLDKTKLRFLPWEVPPIHDLSITIENAVVSLAQTPDELPNCPHPSGTGPGH